MNTATPMPQTSGHTNTVRPEIKRAQDPDFSAISCPFCASADTRVLSLFGGNAGELLMRCGSCHTAFHWIKWQGKLPPHPGAPSAA